MSGDAARKSACATCRLCLGWDLGFEPAADCFEHYLAIALEHHEVAVSEDALVLEIEGFGIAAGLLEERDYRLRATGGPLGDDISDRDTLQVLELLHRSFGL